MSLNSLAMALSSSSELLTSIKDSSSTYEKGTGALGLVISAFEMRYNFYRGEL